VSTALEAHVFSSGALHDALRDKRLLVLDYDGTLAHLDIDWQAVRKDLSTTAAEFNFISTFRPLWPEMARFRATKGSGPLGVLLQVLSSHERRGLERQRPRQEMVEVVRSTLDRRSPQLAVFSSNLHATVSQGLARLGLAQISQIVGADDVDRWKPDPQGLIRLVRRTRVAPEDALFVGDSEGDERAATLAGVDFMWA